MPATSNLFETEPLHPRTRLAASVDLMRELSRSSDPQEMYQLFARRMDDLFPVTVKGIALAQVAPFRVRRPLEKLWVQRVSMEASRAILRPRHGQCRLRHR